MASEFRPIQPIPDEGPTMINPEMLADTDDRRIDFEQGISFFPIMTLAVILSNILVFSWQIASGALASKETIIAAGALVRSSVLNGETWRMVTAMFLHGSWDHLIGNCLVLYVVGMACEHAFGLWQTMFVYLGSGLAGSLLSILFNPGPAVGASGAIFGVTGCLVLFFYRQRHWLILRSRRVGFVLMFWSAYTISLGFLTPYIDNFAHLGGFIFGIIITLAISPRQPFKPKKLSGFYQSDY